MSQKRKVIKGYRISRGYTRLVIWFFSGTTHKLIFTTTQIPCKKITRREKYHMFCRSLKAERIPIPDYQKTKTNG